MIPEILFSFMYSLMGADGEQIDLTVVVLDHSPYYKCLSDTACARMGDNTIFLDINKGIQ